MRSLSDLMMDLLANHRLEREVWGLFDKYGLAPEDISMDSTWDEMYIIPPQEDFEVDEDGNIVFVRKPWPEGYMEDLLELARTVGVYNG